MPLLFVLVGCSSNQIENSEEFIKPDKLILEESIVAKNEEERAASLKKNSELPSQQANTKMHSSESIVDIGGFGSLEKAAKIPPIFSDAEKVSLSVDSMPMIEFIHYVFNDLLNLNYVVSSQLEEEKKKVSLNLKDPVDKAVLYSTAEQLLGDNDIAMLRKDDIVYFQRKDKKLRYKSALVGIGRLQSDIPKTTGKIVQIIPYIYTNSRSLSSVINKLTGVKVQIDGKRKIVTAEGSEKEITEVMRVLRMLDVPSSVGKEVRLLNLAYISPDDLVVKLEELLRNDGYEVGSQNDITFVTMPRLGGIVVYAVSLEAVERVELWSKKLDVAVAGDEPQFYVYRPMFNKAVDLQASLGTILNTILGSSPLTSNADAGKAKEGKSSSSTTMSSMSVDEVQNALIFFTTADKYRKVIELLEKLDQLPGQVILDIVIAEVTLSDNVASGIDWFYDSEGHTAGDSLLNADFKSSAGSFSLSAIEGDWRVAMSFLEKKTKVRVLAKPFLIVKDGEGASINAGDQVPTITQSSTSDTDRVTNSVQYVTTGIQVSVTPTINAKGLINLNVSMSSSAAKATDGFEVSTPTITNRTITTNVFSADGQTVALGGLIREDKDGTGNQVPVLGSLPIVGKLFSSDSDAYTRSELIMLITTRTIKNVNEVDEFRSKILDLYSFPLAPSSKETTKTDNTIN